MTKPSLQAVRQRYQHDHNRPIYHYLPPHNWMNDPNGVIQWRGRYHLFYQYNPLGAYHDNMHWGHAVSDDLVHWQDLDIALAPDDDTIDEGGIFSGCIVDHDGTPTAFYTGVNHGASRQSQCMATSDGDLTVWHKHLHNPVVTAPPERAHQTSDFRDPFVWREGDTWYMLVGSRIEGVGGAVFLYASANLTDWRYLNPLLVGDNARHGIMWECPNFFPLGDQWVLVISSHIGHTTGTVIYFVGDFREHRFYPAYEAVLDSGVYYAPLTHLDDQGRRIMWGWLREARSPEQQLAAGWSGVQAIPRMLSLDAAKRLQMSPVPELKQLRQDQPLHSLTAPVGEPQALPLHGLNLDIEARFEPQAGCDLRFEFPQADEALIISYDPTLETLNVRYTNAADKTSSLLHGRLHRLDVGETLDLRILLDGSVVEIIANQRTSITQRIYPNHIADPRLHIDPATKVIALDVWSMNAIW